MKVKKNLQKRIEKKLENLNDKTKYQYAIYKAKQTAQINTQFGQLLIPQNEILLSPHNLSYDRDLIFTLDKGFKKLHSNSNLDNESLLIFRYGGIGDLICSLFGIVELKKKFKNLRIGYVSSPSYNEILLNFPKLVDNVFNVVEEFKIIKNYKYFCYLDGIVEENNTDTLQDIYAKEMFVKIDNNTLNSLFSYNVALGNSFKRQGFGIQYTSGSLLRNYNIDKLISLINGIHDKYPEEPIFLLGRPDDWTNINYIRMHCNFPLIVNGCEMQKYNLNQLPYIISQLKLVIGPDSSMLHLAGACNTPLIGLFGPFQSDKRISFYNNSIGLDSTAECSPCFRHFPLNFCPYTFGEGQCLNIIDQNLILDQIHV